MPAIGPGSRQRSGRLKQLEREVVKPRRANEILEEGVSLSNRARQRVKRAPEESRRHPHCFSREVGNFWVSSRGRQATAPS
jgi:hypothetical protein